MSYSPENMCHFIKNRELIDLLHTQNHRENAKHTKPKSHTIQKKSQKS
jgi:hypothetical protein